MDVLVAMRVFRRVVELHAFSGAARDLRLSNAAVSKHVAALEEHLRTRLLHRTTRRLSLTTAGAAYYERCVRILDEVAETERSLSSAAAEPHGLLRVNAPMSFGLLHLSPLIPEFLARWPALALDVGFTDRFIDLVEEGVDLVIRIASSLPDSATLVAQRLARARQLLVASPAYLRAHGEPKTLDDLARHVCIVYSASRTPGVWEFVEQGAPRRVTIRGRLVLNSSIAIRDALLAGVGISLLPSFYVGTALRQRRLRVLLPEQEPPPLVVYAAYQRSRHLSAKVRLFSEFLRERFQRAEWAVRDR
jgi:DNA-binding transcriptional LysR family regulator